MCTLPAGSTAILGSIEHAGSSVSLISLDHVICAVAGAITILSTASSVTANNAFFFI